MGRKANNGRRGVLDMLLFHHISYQGYTNDIYVVLDNHILLYIEACECLMTCFIRVEVGNDGMRMRMRMR